MSIIKITRYMLFMKKIAVKYTKYKIHSVGKIVMRFNGEMIVYMHIIMTGKIALFESHSLP
jgi:hypothetical protein